MAQEQNTPSYEDLVRGNRGAQNYKRHLEGLKVGEVREVEIPHGVKVQSVQTSLKTSALRERINIITRTRDGKLYVVRLRDEDVPDA